MPRPRGWRMRNEAGIKGSLKRDLLRYFAWPSDAFTEIWGLIYRIIDKYSPEETNLLHVASKYRLVQPLSAMCKMAEQFGTNIDTKDVYGRTPLSYAAGTLQLLQTRLEKKNVRALRDHGRSERNGFCNFTAAL